MQHQPRSPRPAPIAVAVGLLSTLPLLFTSGGASASADAADTGIRARAVIHDASGAFVGTLFLRQTGPTRVVVSTQANRLSAGFHGLHIHTVGTCDPATTDPAGNPAPFLSAGLHFDPAARGHGAHAGDLPALLATGRGGASAVIETDRFTVASLFDSDGSAIIIHAAPDNLAHIPARYTSATSGAPGPDAATLATGDAGGRLACGVITRTTD
jgi:superoxide dismutase, Cu-Zn family